MKELIDRAMKRAACDLVIRNARIFNVFTGGTEAGEIALHNGKIVGIGSGYPARETYDGVGLTFLPAFLDAHIHVESTMLTPEEFARLVVPHGTGGIVADPHELVNVCGIAGAAYLREAFSRLSSRPLDVYVQLPSCVPATPFETSGASLDARETAAALESGAFFGLGEMMNYPGILAGDADTLGKTEAARRLCKIVDGHAPGVVGDALNAYLCAGIATDHESLSSAEIEEKIARGMYVQIRCGSSANNLTAAASCMNEKNYTRFLLCTDDKHAHDLLEAGHLDDAVRRLIQAGVPAYRAIRAATLNVAECYRLKGKGAVAPGYDADLVGVDGSFRVQAVFHGGRLVAERGKPCFAAGEKYLPAAVRGTVRCRDVAADDFRIRIQGNRARAMYVLPNELVTQARVVALECRDGDVVLDGTDITKLAVVERHFASGRMGRALVAGYGLKGGAIGISVAHDSHNLVVLGDRNAAMARVVALLKEAGGGMALVDGEGEEVFPLDVAGLMSSLPAEKVAAGIGHISARARRMGVKEGYDPFMTLAFLALPVIPHLKLTDRGLFDVDAFAFTSLEV